MDMEIRFPGGDRVEAVFEGLTVVTDQDGSAPAPFELFLASMGTCAGVYVSRFCEQRGIPTADIRILQRTVTDPESHRVSRVEIEIALPDGFPERYRAAVVRAAQLCTVKKHLENPPVIEVTTTTPTAV